MRKTGSPNRAFPERRAAMIARVREHLLSNTGTRPSWRELAAAAGVSLSTLTHYFGKRDDVVRAVMEDDYRAGAEPLAEMAQPEGAFEDSILSATRHLADGFRWGGLDGLFAMGLAEGLGHPALGPCFLANALDPTLAACEERLAFHQRQGEMRVGDLRAAAIGLIAPIVVAFLHQAKLGGEATRRLDLDAFVDTHARAFVRAWQAEA